LIRQCGVDGWLFKGNVHINIEINISVKGKIKSFRAPAGQRVTFSCLSKRK
jgi:hypothetical protein